MTLRGFETVCENPTNPSVCSTSPQPVVPESGSVGETSQMAAFVASLSAQQRAKLTAMLMG